jgi:hypothetical protein
MGKISKRIQRRQAANPEGRITVTFTFDGMTHQREHFLTQDEVAHMKQLCKDHGEIAADQIVWRQAVRYAGYFAENVLAVAGQSYVLKHHKAEQKPVQRKQSEQPEQPQQSAKILQFPSIAEDH